MKEFEKIWENYYANYSSYEGIKHEQNMARHFHRAALEWVLSIDSGFCSCGVPNDSWQEEGVLAKIEKELKD